MKSSARLLALLAILFWGISFVATRAVLREISPVMLIVMRSAIGSLLLVVLVRELPPRSAWPGIALMGFIGVFFHQVLQAYALTLTTAVHTGWLIGVTPIWSAVLAALFLGESFDRWKFLALVGGFAGVVLVITRGHLDVSTLALPSTRGDLLILLSTLNWAIYSVASRRTIRQVGSARATTGGMIAGFLMLLPLMVARRGWRELAGLSVDGWIAVLFLGICCSALGYLFWYRALQELDTTQVAIFLYLEPLVTLVAAMVMLHEPVSFTTVAGGLLVIGSVALAQFAAGPRSVAGNAGQKRAASLEET